MNVPFFRPSIGEEEIAAVAEAMRSGWLTTGPKTQEFEQAFAHKIGDGIEALAVNSATAALHLGLEALGVVAGDEIIVPTLTFTATAEVVRYLGAKPVFVDIDRTTLCVDVKEVRKAITSKTKVIMPVHFAGRACDMSAIRAVADEYGLKVLDDAAHALPTTHQGKMIGDCGADATAFSFYANKTMTTGEGGMLTTRDPVIAARVRTMRLHGIDRDVFNRFTNVKASWIYDVVAPGYKYNMTDVASAMGVVQLARCDEFALRRAEITRRYNAAFADLPLLQPPPAALNDTHSWHLHIVQTTTQSNVTRDGLIDGLKAVGIGTSVHYRPLHQMTYWKSYCEGQSFPKADEYFKSCVSLPNYMAMSDVEQDYVISHVRRLLAC